MLIELTARFEDRPADAFVAFVQNVLQLAQHVFAAGDALLGALPDDVLCRLEQKLLRENHIGSIGVSEAGIGAPAHRGEALIGSNGPGVHRPGAAALAIVFKQRRTRGRLITEVVDTLPVSRENTGRRVEVRQHAGVHTSAEEVAIRAEFHQPRDVVQAFGCKCFGIAHPSAEGDDDQLVRTRG